MANKKPQNTSPKSPNNKTGQTNLSSKDTALLWGRAAGRCEFRGCNKILYKDPASFKAVNLAERAHLIAQKAGGPRGDEKLSGKMAADIENVMLVCRMCHDRIDAEPSDFPLEMLLKMKCEHEGRVQLVTSFAPDAKSHMVMYSTFVGDMRVSMDKRILAEAMMRNGTFPAEYIPIDLSNATTPMRDWEPGFWSNEEKNLVGLFERKLSARISETGDIKHISVFAIAPVPLLIRLGTLFTDKCAVDVYQKRREPDTWDWSEDEKETEFLTIPPAAKLDKVALVLSLSADIPESDIYATLGRQTSLWQVRAVNPNYSCINTKKDLSRFRDVMRSVFNQIKKQHGSECVIHLFAAVPVSAAVEIGRTWMPRADLPLQTYNRLENRIFQKAILIGKENTK